MAIQADSLATEIRDRDRERFLAIHWEPATARPALLAITAYDLEQARIVAEVREAMLAEIRLAWWREQLTALGGGAPAPAQPILEALARDARPRAVDLAALAAMEEGHLPHLWEGPQDAAAMAVARGAPLFEAMASAIAGRRPEGAARAELRAAGSWWAAARLLRDHAMLVPPESLPLLPQLRRLPPSLAGLAALARQDLQAGARSRTLAVAGSGLRQVKLAVAALRSRP